LTVIANRANKWGNDKIDFSNATITVRGDDGSTVSSTKVLRDSVGYGVPNILSWTPGAITTGRRYTVTVSNVGVEGVMKEYSWWFRLVD
jgi:hypothetical protein